jgi:hypothetical protein
MARGKKRNQDGNTRRGAPDHFTGFKLAFLDSRADSYQQALDLNNVAAFYNKVTSDFVAKYGQEEPFHKEPAEDPPDPEDVEAGDGEPEETPLSQEDADRKALLFTKLRTVSKIK